MPETLPLALQQRIDQACDEFEAAWKRGERPSLQALWSQAAATDRAVLLEQLLLIELAYRRRNGEWPSAEEYCAQFPEASSLVLRVFGQKESLPKTAQPRVGEGTSSGSAVSSLPESPEETQAGQHELSADRNLLFGMLALQMDFINRDGLLKAMHTWVLQKKRPLGEILMEQESLSADRHALLDALVREHLKQHNHDTQQSLAALGSIEAVRPDLEKLADSQVDETLMHISGTQRRTIDDSGFTTIGTSASLGYRFVILRPHAEGGLGQVSVALDKELNREVALKEIQPDRADDPDSRARFVLEAQVTGGLEHPGVVPVYGLGQYSDGRPYYAMRFIRGDSLKATIGRFHSTTRKRQSFESREFRELLSRFLAVCNAVEYAHSRGVLHRDLKPDNIMLGKYGETLIVDWGLTKVVGRTETVIHADESTLQPAGSGSAPTRLGAAMGTPAYMSPEQADGQLDQLGPVTDVYGLGATLYSLLTGQPPVANCDVPTALERVRHGDIPKPRQLNSKVPKALEAICLKAMALKPADRYGSPRQLADEIERWLADEAPKVHCPGIGERSGRFLRRHRTLAGVAATTLLLTGIGLPVVMTQQVALTKLQLEATENDLADVGGKLVQLGRQSQAVPGSVTQEQGPVEVEPPVTTSHHAHTPLEVKARSDKDEAVHRATLAHLEKEGLHSLALNAERLDTQAAALRTIFPERAVGAQATSQSCLSFLALKRTPLQKNAVVVLQPLGTISTSDRKTLEKVRKFLEIFFERNVPPASPELTLPNIPADRSRPTSRGVQIDAAWLIDQIPPQPSGSAIATIGITTSDIYGSGLGWIFGMNNPDTRKSSAVISLNRLHDTEPEKYPHRTAKLMTLLVAQAFWVRDYPHYECIMNPANSLLKLDRQRLECCPECEQKIWWACGIDPKQRYQRLIDFAREHGFSEEENRWLAAQQLVGSTTVRTSPPSGTGTN